MTRTFRPKAAFVVACLFAMPTQAADKKEERKEEAKLPEILLWNHDAPLTHEKGSDPKQYALKTRVYPLDEQKPLVVRFDSRCVKTVKFTETARNSVLEEDLQTLAKKLVKSAGAVGECDPDLENRRVDLDAQYVPKFERSTIKATAIDQDGKELGGVTIYYGPREHLHLAIDLPVSNRKTLKYDSASGTLQPKDEKPQVYLSLNHRFGDLLDKPKTIADRLEVKFLVLASKRPLDSFGVGIGARLDDIQFMQVDLKGLSIFGGYFRTKIDKIVDGVPRTNEGTDGSWRLGISYDLSAGLKWASF